MKLKGLQHLLYPLIKLNKLMTKALINKDWLVFETADDVARKGLELILDISQRSIEENGEFHIVLAGGTTPRNIYQLLAKQACEWQKWHFYIGDERCLPINDPERNSEMVRTTLLENINVPDTNIHFIQAELEVEQAAQNYSDEIAKVASFDLVMLGMGEDGHTASLFPGHNNSPDELVHAVYNSPKPPSTRVSMSASLLSQNKNLMLLITGESKKEAIRQWQEGIELPITTIKSLGETFVLLDKAAINTQ